MKEKYRKLKSLNFLYEISQSGELRNVKSKKILKPKTRPETKYNKYYYYTIRNKNYYQHRLLAEAWLDKPENWENLFIHHIDGNKQNNSLDNLEFIDPSEHRRLHMTTLFKEFNEERVKAVYSPDLQKEFSSIKNAGIFIGEKLGIKPRNASLNIAKVCRGEYKRAYSYTWTFI